MTYRDFDPEWHVVMASLSALGVEIEPGAEVMAEGRVLDLELAVLRVSGRELHLVDAARVASERVVRALEARGHHVLRVHADELDLLDRICAAVGI
jgi:hypothetical protein